MEVEEEDWNWKTQKGANERRWVSVNRGSYTGWEKDFYYLEGPGLFWEVNCVKMRRMPVALTSWPRVTACHSGF